MKKIFFAILLSLLCGCLFTAPVFAQEPPTVIKHPDSVVGKIGERLTLECYASSPDGGTVKYAWYRCASASADDEGEELSPASSGGGAFTPPTDVPGVFYYYCAVFNVHEDGAALAKSEVATVTVTGSVVPLSPVIITDLETSYDVVQSGELVLSVVCREQAGPVALQYQWYLKNPTTGAFEKISGATADSYAVPSDTPGEFSFFCRVSATHENESATTQSVTATVTVTAHIHEFGEWETVTSPTCMTAGEERRSCACGTSERRELSALGHDFGEWVVTRTANAVGAGEESRTCSRCGLSELRELPYQPQTTTPKNETTKHNAAVDVTADTTEVPVDAPENGETADAPEASQESADGQFPWWTAIIIFGIVSTLGGGALSVWFFLCGRRLQESARAEELKKQKAVGADRMKASDNPPAEINIRGRLKK